MKLAARLLRAVISLWLIVTFVFVALRLTGDPVLAVLNPDDMTKDMIESYRKLWGFEGTIGEQYLIYVTNVMHGNFGKSILNGRDAFDTVMERLPATLQLIGASASLMILIGLPVGTWAAIKAGSKWDGAIMSFSTLGFAIPNFFFGLLLILVFSVSLRWLPTGGTGTWAHMIMPVVTIGVAKAAVFTRFVRSAMLDALKLQCVTSARARGLSETRVLVRHVFPNALVPLATILPLLVGGMISAAAVVEAVFAWPGIGRLIVESVAQRNLAIVQVIIMLVAFVMIVTNLIVDLIYSWLDPRASAAAAN
ncbi:MAG: ABC transporter permease [Alphaproteobacteria bacterium]